MEFKMFILLLKIISPLAYLISAIFFFIYFNRRDELHLKKARILDHIAILIHGIFLIVLTIKAGHLPLAGAFQALSVFMFIFAILNKIIVREDKDYSLGFLYAGILFLLQGLSMLFISETTVLPVILQDVAFEIHVIFNLVGYAAFSSAFLLGTMYLLLINEIKSNKMGYFYDRLPSLAYLERLNYNAVMTGFIFNTVGILLGSIIGISAWGTYWTWDPKLTSALMAWILYLAAIIGKTQYRWHGRRIAQFSILGFVWILFSMLIITQFFSGIHSFK
jgi:ABC-type transport system involved in cytochrome c biogenesis permease subunit